MCIFTGEVETVKNTRIFAREVEAGVQGLIYQMDVSAPKEVAMVLPLPVKTPVWEKGVRFLNLDEYPDLFDNLSEVFPRKTAWGSDLDLSYTPRSEGALKVVEVGSYVASFVPTMADFKKLDKRFQVPKESWSKLPHYRDYGFAVFQLKPGNKKLHPMALTFESRLKGQLFFPTVHIHDGEVHRKEHFHHTLYAQGWTNGNFKEKDWEESTNAAGKKVSEKQAKGMVWAEGKVFRKQMQGRLKNEDQFLTAQV